MYPVLDLTRTISRIGRGRGTGIDRVERAWLQGLLGMDLPMSGLARTSAGYCWMDRDGCRAVLDLAEGRSSPGRPDALSRLSLKLHPVQRAVESELRRVAVGRALRGGLAGLLDKHVPPDATYFNLGHSHLEEASLKVLAVRMRVIVMIHDVIPIRLPGTQKPGVPDQFQRRLAAAAAHAHAILTPSQATAEELVPFAPGTPVHAVALGVSTAVPSQEEVPADPTDGAPYMLSVGTIDPRKNQEILLDIWQAEGASLPQLILAGTPGWGPPALLGRLETPPAGVHVLTGLSDEAIAALMAGAVALLHPSKAEGYGLPPSEAAAFGTPLIVSDLPALRETLGDMAVYVPPDDGYQWMSAIKARGEKGPPSRVERERAIDRWDRPTWETHLNLALTRLG